MMSSKYRKLKFDNIKTYSIQQRYSKVRTSDFSRPLSSSDTIDSFVQSLPSILVGADFKEFVGYYRQARANQKTIIWMIGAHTIKCGLSPILISLMKAGYISHLAMNGAGAIHDVEVAMWGVTSEDVSAGLQDGSFGMARETAGFMNGALAKWADTDCGFGESIARELIEQNAPQHQMSLLRNAFELEIPVTLHPALGTEIVHQHPGLNGAVFGEKSLLDFQIFTHSVSRLDKGSLVLNVGSAVILPEVFLKALTVVRNLKFPAYGFHTAVFDMIRHYRPTVNVVQRPTRGEGTGYYFIGHHEIMIPLLAAAIQ